MLEEGLIETIIEDVREQPGALCRLLQYALTELYSSGAKARCLPSPLIRISAARLGALAKRAEEVYRRFNEAGQNMARQMFLAPGHAR